jgi:hypothetical protein
MAFQIVGRYFDKMATRTQSQQYSRKKLAFLKNAIFAT